MAENDLHQESQLRPSNSDPIDIGHLREHYDSTPLNRSNLDTDPIRQFDGWFREARKAELPEPNAMTLATVGAEGTPTTRTVLLKAYDADGFLFFTNFRSTKAQQIAENSMVAMTFPWLTLQRQVNISGTAEKIRTTKSIKYFFTRPPGSQLGAWISQQSSVISSRKILQMKFEETKRKFRSGKIPFPSFWGGFRVRPLSIEFWQGRPHRLHDRFRYRRDDLDSEWIIERLAP